MAFEGDPLAFYGKNIIEDYHATLRAKLPSLDDGQTSPFDISDDKLRFYPFRKVGILGAGPGGLYTALMLDSLHIEYEILESTNRTGGHLFTYKFPGGKEYDYYDAGAMRYPLPKKDGQGHYKNGIMKRLAELIIYPPLNQGSDPLRERLIPYYYKARKGSTPGFYYFNGVREPITDKPRGSFRAREMGVAADYARAGVDAILTDVAQPFVNMLVNDYTTGQKTGWEVMKANDNYSLRAYMAFKYIPSVNLGLRPQHLPNDTINWCELLDSSTGAYDNGLTERIIGDLAFASVGDTDFGDVDWVCFRGGSEVLAKKMEEYINRARGANRDQSRIQFGKRVTAIRQSDLRIDIPFDFPEDELPSGTKESSGETIDISIDEDGNVSDARRRRKCVIPDSAVTVTVNGEETRVYSHVISTLPLPILRTIDMKGAGMSVMQKNALRELEYGPSVKIAVRFTEPWWTNELGIIGGQSYTDLPLRTIVYPSYGVDSANPSTVLIASYTWTTDAKRLAALSGSDQRDVLKELVLRNLAEAHGSQITYEYLLDKYVDMNIKDWNSDPHEMGAFAEFGPGEFQNLYTALSYPAANKRLHFAGEALSTRHGWVVGALDSAWRAVYEYLKVTKQDAKMMRFKELWGENAEWGGTQMHWRSAGTAQPDLLDEHLGLVAGAIGAGEIEFHD